MLEVVGWEGIKGAALWIVLAAVFFYLTGMTTLGWATYKENNYQVGLWDACICNQQYDKPSWYVATQAMITMGGLFLAAGFILGVLYAFTERFKTSKFMIAIIAALGLSALFALIGVSIFGSKVDNLLYKPKLSYSYAFTTIGLILSVIAVGISCFQWSKNKS